MTKPTIQFMVDELLKDFSVADSHTQTLFRETLVDDLPMFHHILGRDIRNRFKLWDYPWEPELVDGVDYSPEHPTSVSMRVIETLWNQIQKETV